MKITIHPLFAVLGVLSALFGGLPIFVIYTLTALLHECGHILCARKLGYDCSQVKLMPYGAAAVCEIDGISAKDELKLALAGPMVNAAFCVVLAGLWWFYPVTYAYTDTLMTANTVMLAINLLPAYPLDGGRAARCLLTKLVKPKTARVLMRVVTLLFAAAFVTLFFVLRFNVTCLIFGLFLALSAIEKPAYACKINFADKNSLKRGLEVKCVLVADDITYRRAVNLLDEKKYVILRTDGGRSLTQDELYSGFVTHTIYDKVFE